MLLGLGQGNYWTAVLPGSAVLGLGMALTVAPLSSSVNNTVARTASLLAIAALGLLLVGAYRAAQDTRLAAVQAPVTLRTQLSAQAPRLTDIKLPPGTPAHVRGAVQAAFGDAFARVALAAGLLSLLAAAGWVFLCPTPRPAR